MHSKQIDDNFKIRSLVEAKRRRDGSAWE